MFATLHGLIETPKNVLTRAKGGENAIEEIVITYILKANMFSTLEKLKLLKLYKLKNIRV